MALRTLGTNATTSLTALVWGTGQFNSIDFGNFKNLLKRDNPLANPLLAPELLEQNGILKFPGRTGLIAVNPGDVLAVDPASGWPVVISANAIATGAFTLT